MVGRKHARGSRFGNLSICERGNQGRVADGGIDGLGWKGLTGREEGWKGDFAFQSSNLPTFQSVKPMFFLVLNIVLLSGFGLFLKHAKDNQQRLNPIGFVNYLVASFISIWVLSQEQDFEFSKLTFVLGISNGVTYAAGFELFYTWDPAQRIVVTAALVRLSIVVPILVSMLFWKEIPNLWQAVGLLLTFVAIPLLSQREKEPTYKFTPDRPEMPQVWGSLLRLRFCLSPVSRDSP